jgi:hypothetical protein
LVGEVGTSYSAQTTFSTLTTGVVNAISDWMNSTKNFGASDREGGTGLDYVSAKDPRIKVDGTKVGRGQDGTPTPAMNQYPNLNSNVVIASGVEARMIEAEAQLAAGNTASFLATLNAARATVSGLAPLADPGTATGRQDMLFRERAFSMYTTAHRLGDIRAHSPVRPLDRIRVPDRRLLQGRLVRHGRDTRSVAAGDEQPELDGLYGQERVAPTRRTESTKQAACTHAACFSSDVESMSAPRDRFAREILRGHGVPIR